MNIIIDVTYLIYGIYTNFRRLLCKNCDGGYCVYIPFLYIPIFRLTKLCRYYWHTAGSLGWPFPMLKYKYIFFK